MVQDARETVMAYIKAMGERDFAAVRSYLADNVRVKGREPVKIDWTADVSRTPQLLEIRISYAINGALNATP